MATPAPPFKITTPFGKKGPMWRWLGFHTGDDYACPDGTLVRASHDGTVEFAALTRGSFGRYVRLGHGGGVTSYYCHLSSLSVRAGERVQAGEVVGRSGQTGNTSGPHLHYEERGRDGMPRRPALSGGSAVAGASAASGLRVVWWDRLVVGMRDSDSVRHLQRRLNHLQQAGLPLTGNYLEQTTEAVARFQESQGWTGKDADGAIFPGGRETCKRLFPAAQYDLRFSSSKDMPVMPGPEHGDACGDYGYDPAADEDVSIDGAGHLADITLVGRERLDDALQWWLRNSSAERVGGELRVLLDGGANEVLNAQTDRKAVEAYLARKS